jgi:succinate dehydrogenase/fumarate reductase flavoprotein subunit
VFLKLNHLHENTISEIESILHKVERPSRGTFHEGRGTNYRRDMIEMHISEIGFCSGHCALGVFVDEFARTTVPGLYAAGDMASVPHSYMLGAFTNGSIAGEDAVDYAGGVDSRRSIPSRSRGSATACSRPRCAIRAFPPTRSNAKHAAS